MNIQELISSVEFDHDIKTYDYKEYEVSIA